MRRQKVSKRRERVVAVLEAPKPPEVVPVPPADDEPRLIGKLQALEQETTVYFATAAQASTHLDGEGVEGAYESYGARIFVRSDLENLSPSRMRGTIVHEAVHALLDVTGAGHFLRAESGRFGDAGIKIEEQFVRLLAPGLTLMLPSLYELVGKIEKLKAIIDEDNAEGE